MAVIYLTGAPATGKTTCGTMLARETGMTMFSYGAELTRRLADRVGSQEELRQRSAAVITAADVVALDQELVERTAAARVAGPGLVVDSHAVTKEHYGFRCIPYSPEHLSSLGFTAIVCLFVAAEEVARRISEEPLGRPLPTLAQLAMHDEMQRSLAITYAHRLGVPVHLVDASAEPAVVVTQIRGACDI
jgi:adenylate kinase